MISTIMSTVKITLPDGTLAEGSPSDVAELLRLMRPTRPVLKIRVAPRPDAPPPEPEGDFDPRTATRDFLEVLASPASDFDTQRARIMRALRASHPKGVGPRLAKVNSVLLQSLGLQP